MNEHVQLRKVETWFDPLDMFRQIAPHGIVHAAPEEETESSGGTGGNDEARTCPVFKGPNILPQSGEALAIPEGTEETAQTREEMSTISKEEAGRGLMNRE